MFECERRRWISFLCFLIILILYIVFLMDQHVTAAGV